MYWNSRLPLPGLSLLNRQCGSATPVNILCVVYIGLRMLWLDGAFGPPVFPFVGKYSVPHATSIRWTTLCYGKEDGLFFVFVRNLLSENKHWQFCSHFSDKHTFLAAFTVAAEMNNFDTRHKRFVLARPRYQTIATKWTFQSFDKFQFSFQRTWFLSNLPFLRGSWHTEGR